MGSVDPKVLLLKEETTPGVDANPTGALNAILINDEVSAPVRNLVYADRNNAKGFYGRDQSLVVGGTYTIGFSVELAGAGAAGTAPKYAPALITSGCSEKVLAAPHSGQAQGGAASTVTLAVAANATDNAYQYMTIRITSGTGSGQSRVIKSYVGATKIATVYKAWTTPPDATSQYTLDACAVYTPNSNDNKSATIYFFYDDRVHKLLYAKGTYSMALRAGGADAIPMLNFEFTGIYGGEVTQAFPTAVLTGFTQPLPVNNLNTGALALHGVATGLQLYSAELQMAQQIAYRNIVGVEDTRHTDREPAGSIEITNPPIATLDVMDKVNTGAVDEFSITHGTAAGNRVRIYTPHAQLTNPRYGNQEKVITRQLDLILKPSDLGNDEIILNVQ